MIINKSILLNCNPEKLWQWITEFDLIQEWNTTLIKEEVNSEDEPGPGFKSKVLIREGKKEIWYESEILEYESEKKLIMMLKGGNLGKSPMKLEYQIKSHPNGTELSYTNTWKPSELMLKLLHPLIKKMATKNMEGVLSTLKTKIEEN